MKTLHPVLVLLASSCLAPTGRAQPAPPPPSVAATDPEAVVTLSPFDVTTAKDLGYLANDTLAGSRLRTKLSDVPNAVSVFTPEFMADLNAFGESDLLRYSASAVPERSDQTAAVQGINTETGVFGFRIRGQLATRSRNYFGTVMLPDTFNSERFEEARGPNAILFGLGGAGGILNTSTKQARLGRTSTALQLTGGGDGLLRAHLDHNRVLSDRLAVRVNALAHTADGWQRHQFAKNRRLAFAATWRPWQNTTVRLDLEYGRIDTSLSRFYAPFDNVSLWKSAGSPLVPGLAAANVAAGIGKRNATPRVTFVGNDDSFHNFQQTVYSQPQPNRANSVILPGDWAAIDSASPYPRTASFAGPGGRSEFRQRSLGVVAESEPFRNFFLELAAVNELRDQDVYDTTHEVFRVLGEPGQTFRDGAANPWAGSFYTDTRWVLRHERNSAERFRGTASYVIDLGKFGRHSLAGLLSRDTTGNPRHTDFLVLDGAPFNPQPQQAANQIWTRRYVTDPSDPAQFAAPDLRRIPSSFGVVLDAGAAPRSFKPVWAKSELNDQWRHIDSRLFALQSTFLEDRLIATAGWRYTGQAAFTRLTNDPNPAGPLAFVGPVASSAYDFERASGGLVAKPLGWLSLYCNYSENAQIPGTTQTLVPDGSPFPLNTGKGGDYGAMLSLLGGRIFVRAGYFTTASVDQSRASATFNVHQRNDRIMDTLLAAGLIAPDRVVRYTGGDFDLSDLVTDGYELNLTANVTPAWRILFNASRSRSVESNMLKRSRPAAARVLPLWQTPAAQSLVTTAGVTVAQEILNFQSWLASSTAVEGTGTVGHRELEARVFSRYDFRAGALKGVFAGGGLSYGSAPVIGRGTGGELFRAAVRREADLLLGYKFLLPRVRRPVELQLNVNNLLQQSPYTLVRRDPDAQNFRAVLNPPTSYSLGARVSF